MAVLGWAHLPIFGQVIFSQIHFQFLEIKHPLFAVLCLLLLLSTAYCYVVFFLHFPISPFSLFLPFPQRRRDIADPILVSRLLSFLLFLCSSLADLYLDLLYISNKGKTESALHHHAVKGNHTKSTLPQSRHLPLVFQSSLYLCQSINDLIQSLGYKTENTDWTVRQ